MSFDLNVMNGRTISSSAMPVIYPRIQYSDRQQMTNIPSIQQGSMSPTPNPLNGQHTSSSLARMTWDPCYMHGTTPPTPAFQQMNPPPVPRAPHTTAMMNPNVHQYPASLMTMSQTSSSYNQGFLAYDSALPHMYSRGGYYRIPEQGGYFSVGHSQPGPTHGVPDTAAYQPSLNGRRPTPNQMGHAMAMMTARPPPMAAIPAQRSSNRRRRTVEADDEEVNETNDRRPKRPMTSAYGHITVSAEGSFGVHLSVDGDHVESRSWRTRPARSRRPADNRPRNHDVRPANATTVSAERLGQPSDHRISLIEGIDTTAITDRPITEIGNTAGDTVEKPIILDDEEGSSLDDIFSSNLHTSAAVYVEKYSQTPSPNTNGVRPDQTQNDSVRDVDASDDTQDTIQERPEDGGETQEKRNLALSEPIAETEISDSEHDTSISVAAKEQRQSATEAAPVSSSRSPSPVTSEEALAIDVRSIAGQKRLREDDSSEDARDEAPEAKRPKTTTCVSPSTQSVLARPYSLTITESIARLPQLPQPYVPPGQTVEVQYPPPPADKTIYSRDPTANGSLQCGGNGPTPKPGQRNAPSEEEQTANLARQRLPKAEETMFFGNLVPETEEEKDLIQMVLNYTRDGVLKHLNAIGVKEGEDFNWPYPNHWASYQDQLQELLRGYGSVYRKKADREPPMDLNRIVTWPRAWGWTGHQLRWPMGMPPVSSPMRPIVIG